MESLSIRLQFGWAFISTLIALVLIFSIARIGCADSIHEQRVEVCQQLHAESVKRYELNAKVEKQLYPNQEIEPAPFFDRGEICDATSKSIPAIAMDFSKWSYSDVYNK